MKIFNLDSPLMQILSKVTDMIILNILTLICSLPIVTAGAALTALYDASWRLMKDEGHPWKDFWKAFLSNFKKATIIWLILILIGIPLGIALVFYAVQTAETFRFMLVLEIILAVFWVITMSWVFIMQAKFENTVMGTIRNAFLLSLMNLPRSILMAVLNLIPWFTLLFLPNLFLKGSIILLFAWTGVTAYLNCFIVKKPVEKLIAAALEKKAEEEVTENVPENL